MVDIWGGFVLIEVPTLVSAWRACRSKPLGAGDFRTFLAAHEMAIRRKASGGSPSRFSPTELARLTDVSERRARASVRRLVAAGLITWCESAITFPPPPNEITSLGGLAETIGKGSGSVAVSRRILRHLAQARPAIIAVALAMILRGLSRRRSGWRGWGRFKSSWVAEVFGISIGQVKSARAELVRIGWLIPQDGDRQATLNRWGRAYEINLAWDAKSRPLEAVNCAKSRPPDLIPLSLPGGETQIPNGACAGRAGEQNPPTPILASAMPAPNLNNIHVADLADTDRLAQIQTQAAQKGFLGMSEADHIRVVATAERCRRIGKNPAAMFASMIRRGCPLISLADEDAARRKLAAARGHQPFSGRSMAIPTPRPAPVVVPISEASPPVVVPLASPVRRSSFIPNTPAAQPMALGSVLSRLAVGLIVQDRSRL